MHEIEIKKMLDMALNARGRAYAPYSSYKTGACVKAESGAYYYACNVENPRMELSVCAERAAIFKGISECERRFTAIAMVGTGDAVHLPCPACREVFKEFLAPDAAIITATQSGRVSSFTLDELISASAENEQAAACQQSDGYAEDTSGILPMQLEFAPVCDSASEGYYDGQQL